MVYRGNLDFQYGTIGDTAPNLKNWAETKGLPVGKEGGDVASPPKGVEEKFEKTATNPQNLIKFRYEVAKCRHNFKFV